MSKAQAFAEMISTLVRPFTTIMLVGTLCYIAIISEIKIGATEFLTIVAMALSFWFGVKSGENTARAAQDTNNRSVVNNVNQSPNPNSSPAVINNLPNPEPVPPRVSGG